MRNFAKKLISTVMALALTATMSVYAEETDSVLTEAQGIYAGSLVNGIIGCGNHVTFRGDNYIVSTYYTHKVMVNDNWYDCNVETSSIVYDETCMKCHQIVRTVKVSSTEYHSIIH